MKRVVNKKGFTLIEVAIVAVTIGIISAIAVPRFGKVMTKLKIKAAGRDIISQLRLARSYAVSQKKPYGVYFDVENNKFMIFKDKVNLSSQTYDAGDSTIKTFDLPLDVALGYTCFNNDVVIFNPNGSASSTGSVDLYPQAQEVYDYIMIDVLASTGRVKMYKGGDYY